MAWFTGEELNIGLWRYHRLTGLRYQDFYDWLGTTWEEATTNPKVAPITLEEWRYHIPDKFKHRMDMLLSPHYQTLYKAWKIRCG
jgi:hypothetical protein